jgi:large subunit ribosomal protein L24e
LSPKRNPRKIDWTVLYRRKHKKGQQEEVSKKRTKRSQKFQRAVVGATLQDILAKRNQKPDVRKAQREQAIRAAKEVKKTQRATKKPAAAAAKAKPKTTIQKASKNVQKAAPRVGGKRKDLGCYKVKSQQSSVIVRKMYLLSQFLLWGNV